MMPPVDEPPGRSTTRQDAFRQFYRLHHDVMYEVVVDDRTVGMIRLTPTAEDGTAETGMWLGASTRGKGISTSALNAVLDRVADLGWKTVVADTTPRPSGRLSAAERPCRMSGTRCWRRSCCKGLSSVNTEAIVTTAPDWMTG
ncbi:MAG TPA: GNAT family N-acetyltransferase [Umezawaea sp.]|nr:GNAT family N-acetyltransferase [Umezawaea sp.]